MGNAHNLRHEHVHKNMAKHKINAAYIPQPSVTRISLNLRCGIHNGLCRHVLVVGSTCHIQMERFFYFTGTTEQEGQR
jgi:hypothetical protein